MEKDKDKIGKMNVGYVIGNMNDPIFAEKMRKEQQAKQQRQT